MKVYDVEGMTCEGCVKAVKTALERKGLEGTVDLAEGQVTLEGTPDDHAVVKAIEGAGFDVRKRS